jgi:iron-sulfur cluster repair protein YtfE (RIC family)
MTTNTFDTQAGNEALALHDTPLTDWLIRDLVDAYPQTLSVLGPLGIDLCCGGGHPLGEALDLHGLDRDAVLPRIAQVVSGADPEQA